MDELRHSETFWRLFSAGMGLWRPGKLAPSQIEGLPRALPADRPLLIVANHSSWWDGFLLRELQVALRPGVPFHTAVLERQLRAHPILRRLGGVPLDPGRPASLTELIGALRACRILHPDLVLAWFPQGRIWPATRRPLGFHRGIEVVAAALAPATLLPVSIRIEPLVDPQPTPLIQVGTPIPVEEDSTGLSRRAETAVAAGLDRISALLDEHGESVLNHWPAQAYA